MRVPVICRVGRGHGDHRGCEGDRVVRAAGARRVVGVAGVCRGCGVVTGRCRCRVARSVGGAIAAGVGDGEGFVE